jgi:hypothetical protein
MMTRTVIRVLKVTVLEYRTVFRVTARAGADSLKADLSEDRIIKCEDSSVLK